MTVCCVIIVQEIKEHLARALPEAYTRYRHSETEWYFLHANRVLPPSPSCPTVSVPLCGKCLHSVRRDKKVPKWNVKSIDFGQLAAFGETTAAEQQVCCHSLRFQTTVKVQASTAHGVTTVRGHSISFLHDGRDLVSAVPVLLPRTDPSGLMKVMFVGPNATWRKLTDRATTARVRFLEDHRDLTVSVPRVYKFLAAKRKVDPENWASVDDSEETKAALAKWNETILDDALVIDDAVSAQLEDAMSADIARPLEFSQVPAAIPPDPPVIDSAVTNRSANVDSVAQSIDLTTEAQRATSDLHLSGRFPPIHEHRFPLVLSTRRSSVICSDCCDTHMCSVTCHARRRIACADAGN